MGAAGRARLLALLAGAGLPAAALAPNACSQDCCNVDSYPITLGRAPLGAPPLDGGLLDAAPIVDGGALLALAGPPDTPPGQTPNMVVDTGSPFTVLAGGTGQSPQTETGSWNLYGAGLPTAPLRATFRGWDVFQLPLFPVGDPSSTPQAVLGADLLRGYSVELRFGYRCAPGGSALCTSITFWNHLGEDASLLEDAGYAVVYFTAFGGGEVTADGDPDFLGLRGPLDIPATRVVLRACMVPDAFSPDRGSPKLSIAACTTPAQAVAQASGVDLSLMVDTGVGPLVLAASAWARVVAAAASASPVPVALPPVPSSPPSPAPPPLYVATWPRPIDVLLWAAIPRYALVNLEIGANLDPGPCVELGRARRTEIVSYNRVVHPELDLCGATCDIDPNNAGVAQNSAAYLEVSGVIPVAVIADDELFLQGLRFDVLPEGPELDGLVGAAAFGRARMELDYLSSPSRAVFSCETDAPRSACWAAARCPQLPDSSSVHYCFGLPPHGLPPTCAPPDAGVPDAGGSADGGARDAAGGNDATVIP